MPTWNIDPAHTGVEFSVRHMMVSKVRGKFTGVSGTIEFDPENPTTGAVDVTIDAATINTGVEDRDNHLRSADFLEVEKYPTITFKSTKVEPTGENTAKVYGNLTIHGVTREVVLEAEYNGSGTSPYGQTIVGFSATTKINREDFGLTWNVALEAGGWLVGKEITISLEVEAILATETAAV
ncbi:MAG: polyisoprenoid-binding protein [Chloroflexi bacterium]|nr:MAG: polyisoprenoid-binding protein [Chloroflexota bacterium]